MRLTLLLLLLFPCVLPMPVAAHDIPRDATIWAFIKPSGTTLTAAVRVPLRTVRDLDFPEQPGGYLNVEKLATVLPDEAIIWVADQLELFENSILLPRPRVVATQISIESDRSFASYERSVAHITGPKLPSGANVIWDQVWFDVLLEYPIQSDRAEFSVRPGFDRLATRTLTVLQFLPPGGVVRAYEFTGSPGLVRLDPRWHQAALQFFRLGFHHILDGTDHLLFLFCLVIPFRQLRSLIWIVTAFTIAHSITLIASALGHAPDALWFPPLVETLIAASIVYMALENIAVAEKPRRRWVMAFAFGLIHGFGFSFVLRETLQFAGPHLISSLLWFNAGVEAGQILVLCVLVPLLNLLFRFVVAERMGIIILSALVAHTGWHWMTERWEGLSRFQIPSPDLTWWVALAAAGGCLWAARMFRRRATVK